jgi:hypothetical protein
MGGVAATDLKLGKYCIQVIFVPALVCIAEHEVEGPFKGGNDLVSIPEASIDVFGKSGCFEVFQGFTMPPLVDLDGDQFTASFTECPCDPDPGMPGGCPDLKCSGIFVLENDVVKGPQLWESRNSLTRASGSSESVFPPKLRRGMMTARMTVRNRIGNNRAAYFFMFPSREYISFASSLFISLDPKLLKFFL